MVDVTEDVTLNHTHIIFESQVRHVITRCQEMRGGLVKLCNKTLCGRRGRGWRGRALFPGNGLKVGPIVGGVQEMGAVTIEAIIRVWH